MEGIQEWSSFQYKKMGDQFSDTRSGRRELQYGMLVLRGLAFIRGDWIAD